MACNLCFQLLKYSYCTTPSNSKPDTISWTHVSSDHMYVSLIGKDTNIRNGLLEMSIVRGTATLESIDLGASIDASTPSRAAFASAKDSVIQIGYPIKDNQTRRVQLRLSTIEQCEQVVKICRERGIEFRQARPSKNGGRPDTALSARPNTAQSSRTTSPLFQEERRTSTIRVPDMEAGSLSQRPSDRPATHDRATNDDRSSRTFDFTPPKIIAREVPSRNNLSTRPSTAEVWRSTTLPSQPVALSNIDYNQASNADVNERPSSTSHMANLDAVRQAATDDLPMENGLALPSSPSSVRPATALTSSSGASQVPYRAEQRPNTTLSSNTISSPASADPLRVSSRGSSRPGSATLMMAPLPKPKMVQNSVSSSVRESLSPRKRPASPLRPASAMPSASGQVRPTMTEVRPASSSAHMRFGHATGSNDCAHARNTVSSFREQKQVDPNRDVMSMDELLASNEPLPARSTMTNVSRMGSLADAPHEIEVASGTAHGSHHQPLREDSERIAERAYNTITSATQPQEDEALEEYAAKSPADRMAIMDKFIVDNLENPSFMTLCEDAEKCWRKIGLGL